MNLIAHILEFLRVLFPVDKHEGDVMMKVMIKVLAVGFDDDQGH
jgi:hypothetical protein